MGIRGTMARNLANSVSNFIDTTTNAISTIKEVNDKKETEERLFASNQYKLTQAYKTAVTDKVSQLPQSVDFANYQEQMETWNQEWLSEIKSSGIYDDRTLAWLESEFLPSQKASNEQVVAGVQNYAINAWTANDASNYANVLQADESLSVDDAYEQYKAYYDKLGLANVSQDYGILSPEVFREEIRGAKAQQEFTRLCNEGFGYDASFDVNTAMENAIATAGYKPNAVQKIQYKQACQSILSNRKSELQTAVADEAVSLAIDLNSYITQGKYYDTSALYDAAAKYPVSYSGSILQLIEEAENSNDIIVYNSIIKGDMALDDESLGAFSSGSAYKQTLIENDLTSKAQAMFNSGANLIDVVSWLNNGDVGYTVDSDTREAIVSNIVSWAKDQKELIEDIDEIENFYTENSNLKGSPAVVSWVDTPIFQSETTSGNDTSVEETQKEEQITKPQKGTKKAFSQAVVQDESIEGRDEGKTESSTKTENSKNIPLGITPSTAESATTRLTKAGASSAQSSIIAQQETGSVNNPYTEQELFRMKYVDCLPDDVLLVALTKAYKAGDITKEKYEELATPFAGANNDSWNKIVSYVGAVVDSYIPSKNNDFYAVDRTNAKDAIVQALAQVVAANLSLLDDPAVLQSAVKKISSDTTASKWLKKTSQYTKASDDADGYLKALSKSTYKDVLEALNDGSLMFFIDTDAQYRYSEIDLEFKGSVEEQRDFFTQELGFGNSYKELTEQGTKANLQKLLVEYNVAYAQLRGDVNQLFAATFGDYVDLSKASVSFANTPNGSSFVFKDSSNENLYYVPDLSTVKKEGNRLSCSWYYMYDTNGDGSPDGDWYQFTSMSTILSDLQGYKQEVADNNEKISSIQDATDYMVANSAQDNPGLGLGALVGVIAGLFKKKDKHTNDAQIITDTIEVIRNINLSGANGVDYKTVK